MDEVDETLVDDDGVIEDPPAEKRELFYGSLDLFVQDYICVNHERRLGQSRRWCPKWWEHPEAVNILHSLWMSWEHKRVTDGPCAIAEWLTSFDYPLMEILWAGDGPFWSCSDETGHKEVTPHEGGLLPFEPAPPGLFPNYNEA